MTTLSCCVSTIHPSICIGVSIVQAAVKKMFSYWQLVGLIVFSGDKIVYWDAELTSTVSQIYRNQYMYIEHSHVQPAVVKMFKLSNSWFRSSSFLHGWAMSLFYWENALSGTVSPTYPNQYIAITPVQAAVKKMF